MERRSSTWTALTWKEKRSLFITCNPSTFLRTWSQVHSVMVIRWKDFTLFLARNLAHALMVLDYCELKGKIFTLKQILFSCLCLSASHSSTVSLPLCISGAAVSSSSRRGYWHLHHAVTLLVSICLSRRHQIQDEIYSSIATVHNNCNRKSQALFSSEQSSYT